ncbi:MAG: hypothetical protein ABIO70_02695 [Pseudomonadota bacterium]
MRTAPFALLLAVGCLGHERFAGAEGDPLHTEVPAITGIVWGCSSQEATWAFEVTTDAWTANGDLWLATDTDYVEQHPLRSDIAAGDGSADHLIQELTIAADWRDASSGVASAFLCDAVTLAAMNLRAVVYTPGSGAAADCRSWGADPAFFDQVEGVPACSQVWEAPDTGAGG